MRLSQSVHVCHNITLYHIAHMLHNNHHHHHNYLIFNNHYDCVDTECGVIGACAQVLCTNSSDHRCLDCESNHGHLPGQMAYTNLGTECEGM